ncbi:uncharacterized protein LOC119376054 isoform X2 [Rhipicephalus sanguineus]|uniref:uncharacterized protein LOC119376054 isoform X2 n=1 Tax=Rhipicephalus sanguineus TaxID=34632 RepID=UPI001894DD50|nr:uncharacterized protein LOC119376054 isoform X2 [Rhipicephalus sanguineus]
MDWVNSSTTWNIHPSLAISVSMCTRVYLTTTGMEAKYGDTCQFNDSPPGTSATYCDDYRKLYLTFIIEPTQLVTYANSENYSEYMSTFETQSAVTEKLCDVKIRYRNLDISLALFDIECEDWQNECTNAESNVVQGTDRMSYIYQYMSGSGRTAASLLNRTDPSCP